MDRPIDHVKPHHAEAAPSLSGKRPPDDEKTIAKNGGDSGSAAADGRDYLHPLGADPQRSIHLWRYLPAAAFFFPPANENTRRRCSDR